MQYAYWDAHGTGENQQDTKPLISGKQHGCYLRKSQESNHHGLTGPNVRDGNDEKLTGLKIQDLHDDELIDS